MRKILKWIFIVSASVLLLILVSIAGAHLYLATDTGGRKLLSFINTLYPGKISGSSVEVSLLSQAVSLTDVILKGPDGKVIVRAKQASLEIDLPALLKFEVILKNLYISRPECTLILDDENYLNIERAFVEPTPEVSPWNVYIRNLTLDDGSLSFILWDGDELVRAKNMQFRMDAAFTNDTFLKLAVPSSELILDLSGRTIDLGSSSMSAVIFNDSVKDIRVSSRRAASRLALTGSITGISGKAQLHLAADPDAELADFSKGLGIAGRTEGRLSGRLEIKGDYDNPSATCDLAYGGGSLGGFPVGRARLAGSVSDRVFSCSGLRTDLASGSMDITGTVDMKKVFPKGYFEGEMEGDAVSYDLSVKGTNLYIPEIPGMPEDIKGRLFAGISLKGAGISADALSLNGSFTAKVQGLTIPGSTALPELSMEGQASYSRGSVRFDPVTARTAGTTLIARGDLQTDSRTINGSLNLDAPQIAYLMKSFGVPARGSLTGQASFSGTWEKPLADLVLSGKNCGYQDITLGNVGLKCRLDETSSLIVQECTVNNNKSVVTASGSLGLFKDFPRFDPDLPMDIEATLSSVSPHDFIRDLPLTGSFSGRIAARGSSSDLSGNMELDGKNMAYEGITIDTIHGVATLGNGLLTIPALTIASGKSSLKASGNARIFKNHAVPASDPGIDITIREGKVFLEDFVTQAQGLVNVSGNLQGTLLHPTGTLAVSGGNLSLGQQKFSKLEILARLDGERMFLEPVSLEVSPDQKISGTGWISMKGDYSFSVNSTGLALESMQLYQGLEGIKGTAFIEMSGDGNLKHPMLAGRIYVRDIFFRDRPFKESNLSFHLIDHTITYEGSLNFNLQGSYDLKTDRYQTYAKFDGTELDPYFILMGKPLLSGILTGTLSAAGSLGNLEGSVVEADFSKVDISLKGKNLLLADKLSGSYLNGVLSIPRTHVMLGEKGSFDLTGSGNPKKSLVLDAEGIIPMEVIGSFVEELADSTGFVGFSAHIKPINGRPELLALLSLDDIAYTVSYNGQRITGTNGKIRIENNRVFIEDVKGKLDTGSFELGGTALLKDFTPSEMELYAHVKDLPLAIPDTMDVVLDAEASFDAKGGNSIFRSEILLLDGTYYKDVNVNLLTGVMERFIPLKRQEQQAGFSLPPLLQKTALDVTIRRRGEVRVENNIAGLNINPDLKVGGNLGEPVINGRIAVSDGIVTFQNNEFTVTRGIIDFLNPYRTEATVDIKGQTKVRDWTIDLTISGKLDNLEFELNSTPAEEPSDILSLLIVGKTTREMTQNQSGVTVSPSSMVAELVTGTYGEKVKKVTSLDVLKFESSQFATTGTGKNGENLKLTLGKELSQRLTVTYQMETRDTETVQLGIAEYKLLENLLIRGTQGSNGIFGVDMQYRHEFR